MSAVPQDAIKRICDGWLRDAKSDYAGASARNALNVLSNLTFIEPGQFILELLQNAEDARMELRRKGGEFAVKLYRDRCEVQHNGKPFDEEDLKSLCGIGSRKKPREGYKGYIGIGWKSVYRVSEEVEIYSGSFSFKFSKSFWRKNAAWLKERYDIEPDQVPWQVAPIPVGRTEFVPPGQTLIRIWFRDEGTYKDVSEFLESIKPHMLLFLEHINKIVIEDKVTKSKRVYEWYPRSEPVEKVSGVNVTEGILVANGESSRLLVFRKEFKVPDDVRRDEFTKNAKRDDVDIREVCVALALDKDGNPTPLEEARFWGVYSFLPLPESATGLKFLIQADLIVHPGRRSVNYEARWNAWLMECAAEIVKAAINYLRERKASAYLPVFEYEKVGGPFYEKLIEPTVIRVIDGELGDPLVPCVDGHFIPLSKAVVFEREVRDLVKEFELTEGELKYIYGEEGLHLVSPDVKLRESDERGLRRKLGLPDLLVRDLIKLRKERSTDFLAEVYKRLTGRVESLPGDKRLVITEAGEIVKANEAYLGEVPEELKKLSESEEVPEIIRAKIREFLGKLNYVHKDLVSKLGKDLLKRLGVREVTVQELCRKVFLPTIKAEAKPPAKNEVLTISMILRKAGVKPEGDMWAVDRKAEVCRASELYYPLDCFEPLEVYEELGIRFLGVEHYGNEGWEAFFSGIVKGLEPCYSSYYYLHPHPDYLELVNKLRKALEELTEREKLIQYTRALRKLVERLEGCNFKERLVVNVLTDEGEIRRSGDVYLHPDYRPKQDWYKWRHFYSVGPFISNEYLDEAEADKWRHFLVKYLGVRETASPEQVRDFAERYAKGKLEDKGYRILSEHGDGYDYEIEKDGRRSFVEVKGMSEGAERDVELTSKETEKAIEYRENYWVMVVANIPNSPEIYVIKDPVRVAIREVRIPRERIREGERWD